MAEPLLDEGIKEKLEDRITRHESGFIHLDPPEDGVINLGVCAFKCPNCDSIYFNTVARERDECFDCGRDMSDVETCPMSGDCG
ncbi:MAG: hypothetical protein SVU88_02290 [Candidatus Nanohaloarchaea archaeon]|nr:hypothetical protein [Candidatus Nanohaloarchaea archaeon]